MKIEIINATPAHVQELGRVMNIEDREEVEYLGLPAHRALWRGWKNSIVHRTALADGEIVGMWGVSGNFMGLKGVVWLVTGKKVRELSAFALVELARQYRVEVQDMLTIFPVLENNVDCSYLGAMQMLKIAGFTIDDPKPVGHLRRLYSRFWREA